MRRILPTAVLVALLGAAVAVAAPRLYVQQGHWIVSRAAAGGPVRRVVHVDTVDALGISVGGGSIYWIRTSFTTHLIGTLWRAGLDGSDPHPIVSPVQAIGATAVIGTSVYWLHAGGTS